MDSRRQSMRCVLGLMEFEEFEEFGKFEFFEEFEEFIAVEDE